MLSRLEIPPTTFSSAEKLSVLLQHAVCKYTSCRQDDIYLVQWVVEQDGSNVKLHGVMPHWHCGSLNRSTIPKPDEHFVQERQAAQLIADAIARSNPNRTISFLLDLTDRCTIDLFIDSCRYPLLCHVRRKGSCALPIPYRDWWTHRYGSQVSYLTGHQSKAKRSDMSVSHTLHWRGQPRYTCRVPPWDVLCQRTRLAWVAHLLCAAEQREVEVRRSNGHHSHHHHGSSSSTCTFDAKLVMGALHHSKEAAAFFQRHESEMITTKEADAKANGMSSKKAASSEVGIDTWLSHQFVAEVEGYGYSGAVMWKLLTNRTLVLPDSSENFTTWHTLLLVPSVHYLRLPRNFSAANVAMAVRATSPNEAKAIAANAYSLGKLVSDANPSFGEAYLSSLLDTLVERMAFKRRRFQSNGRGLPPACFAADTGDWGVKCEAEGCEANAPWSQARIFM